MYRPFGLVPGYGTGLTAAAQETQKVRPQNVKSYKSYSRETKLSRPAQYTMSVFNASLVVRATRATSNTPACVSNIINLPIQQGSSGSHHRYSLLLRQRPSHLFSRYRCYHTEQRRISVVLGHSNGYNQRSIRYNSNQPERQQDDPNQLSPEPSHSSFSSKPSSSSPSEPKNYFKEILDQHEPKEEDDPPYLVEEEVEEDDYPEPEYIPEVNPPDFTLPPPHSIPERLPNQSYLPYLFARGKGYARFFKDGLKNIYEMFKAAQVLERRLAKDKAEQDAKQRQKEAAQNERRHFLINKQGKTPEEAAAQVAEEAENEKWLDPWSQPLGMGSYYAEFEHLNLPTVITRAEFQIVTRNHNALKKVAPFAFVVMILGEFTPLVMFYFKNIFPEPCRLPAIQAALDRQFNRRKLGSFERYLMHIVHDPRGTEDSKILDAAPPMSPAELNLLDHLSLPALRHAAVAINAISPSVNRLMYAEYLSERLRSRLVSRAYLVRKIKARLFYLRTDDGLMQRDGDVLNLTDAELKRYTTERGYATLHMTPRHHYEQFKNWMRASMKGENEVVRLVLRGARGELWKYDLQDEEEGLKGTGDGKGDGKGDGRSS